MRSCPCVDYEAVIRLIEENKYLKQENCELKLALEAAQNTAMRLEEKIKNLLVENEKLKETLLYTCQYGVKKRTKRDVESTETTISKKRGAPAGHKGTSRKKPQQIDETVEYILDKCIKCGSNSIKICNRIDTHFVEDIIIKKVVRKILHHYYYCQNCKQVMSTHDKDEIPYRRIGPVAEAVGSYLHNYRKISYGDVKGIFNDLFELELSKSIFSGFDNKICEKGKTFYEMLQQLVKLSSVTYTDETGWQIGCEDAWLWACVSKISDDKWVVVYKIDESRSGNVAENILGENYDGILNSDRYAGYNRIKAKAKQKSLAHILREIKDVERLWEPDEKAKIFLSSIKELLKTAIEIKKSWKKKEIADEELPKKHQQLQQELEMLIQESLSHKRAEKIRKSLLKYKDEIFTFLRYKEVESDTNIVERAIRPNVIMRKITYGNNSPKGATNHEVIMSLLQTAKANGQQPFQLLKLLLQRHIDEDKIRTLLYGTTQDTNQIINPEFR